MKEIELKGRKIGMPVLIGLIVLYVLSLIGLITGGQKMDEGGNPILFVVSLLFFLLGWIIIPGLKILKPQEALVLTLFGKYVGTLKGEGFYFVNPFCSAVNPAAKTKLSQSGDVSTVQQIIDTSKNGVRTASAEDLSRKLSLKIMTLSNNRQKINDCLGNPVEIGIAVTWRITDTAKAVFNVDNYKEFLSLQCDAALRNVVRL